MIRTVNVVFSTNTIIYRLQKIHIWTLFTQRLSFPLITKPQKVNIHSLVFCKASKFRLGFRVLIFGVNHILKLFVFLSLVQAKSSQFTLSIWIYKHPSNICHVYLISNKISAINQHWYEILVLEEVIIPYRKYITGCYIFL